MNLQLKNINSEIPEILPEELFEELISGSNFKLERIVSKGHATPLDTWYDQDKDEWILLIQGSAKLRFENSNKDILLKMGDYVHIPAHCKHRVEWTDKDTATIWLAIHFSKKQ